MNLRVTDDMKWSTKLFRAQVWPLCQSALGGGDLMQMEGRPDVELARQLDMLSGIDGWQIHILGIRGVAARVQTGLWNTFTIRKTRASGATTEYEKRKGAIESGRGWIFPHLTIQAYALTHDGPVLTVGMARTTEIIRFIDDGLAWVEGCHDESASFYVCSWDDMIKHGYQVKVLKPYRELK